MEALSNVHLYSINREQSEQQITPDLKTRLYIKLALLGEQRENVLIGLDPQSVLMNLATLVHSVVDFMSEPSPCSIALMGRTLFAGTEKEPLVIPKLEGKVDGGKENLQQFQSTLGRLKTAVDELLQQRDPLLAVANPLAEKILSLQIYRLFLQFSRFPRQFIQLEKELKAIKSNLRDLQGDLEESRYKNLLKRFKPLYQQLKSLNLEDSKGLMTHHSNDLFAESNLLASSSSDGIDFYRRNKESEMIEVTTQKMRKELSLVRNGQALLKELFDLMNSTYPKLYAWGIGIESELYRFSLILKFSQPLTQLRTRVVNIERLYKQKTENRPSLSILEELYRNLLQAYIQSESDYRKLKREYSVQEKILLKYQDSNEKRLDAKYDRNNTSIHPSTVAGDALQAAKEEMNFKIKSYVEQMKVEFADMEAQLLSASSTVDYLKEWIDHEKSGGGLRSWGSHYFSYKTAGYITAAGVAYSERIKAEESPIRIQDLDRDQTENPFVTLLKTYVEVIEDSKEGENPIPIPVVRPTEKEGNLQARLKELDEELVETMRPISFFSLLTQTEVPRLGMSLPAWDEHLLSPKDLKPFIEQYQAYNREIQKHTKIHNESIHWLNLATAILLPLQRAQQIIDDLTQIPDQLDETIRQHTRLNSKLAQFEGLEFQTDPAVITHLKQIFMDLFLSKEGVDEGIPNELEKTVEFFKKMSAQRIVESKEREFLREKEEEWIDLQKSHMLSQEKRVLKVLAKPLKKKMVTLIPTAALVRDHYTRLEYYFRSVYGVNQLVTESTLLIRDLGLRRKIKVKESHSDQSLRDRAEGLKAKFVTLETENVSAWDRYSQRTTVISDKLVELKDFSKEGTEAMQALEEALKKIKANRVKIGKEYESSLGKINQNLFKIKKLVEGMGKIRAEENESDEEEK